MDAKRNTPNPDMKETTMRKIDKIQILNTIATTTTRRVDYVGALVVEGLAQVEKGGILSLTRDGDALLRANWPILITPKGILYGREADRA
jgi:hypothetical protein